MAEYGQAGMSLTTVLITVGIGGMVAAAMATLYKQTMDAQQHVTQLASKSNISQVVHTLIGNDRSCAATFVNSAKNPPKFDLDKTQRQEMAFYNSADQVVLKQKDSKIKGDGISFKGVDV